MFPILLKLNLGTVIFHHSSRVILTMLYTCYAVNYVTYYVVLYILLYYYYCIIYYTTVCYILTMLKLNCFHFNNVVLCFVIETAWERSIRGPIALKMISSTHSKKGIYKADASRRLFGEASHYFHLKMFPFPISLSSSLPYLLPLSLPAA